MWNNIGRNKFVCLSFVVLFSFIAFGCGKDDPPDDKPTASIIGSWNTGVATVTFKNDGTFEISSGVTGTYTLSGNQITFVDSASSSCGASPGVYTFSFNAVKDQVTFTLVEDICDGRKAGTDGKTWTKMGGGSLVFTLNITTAGNGTGIVTSSPEGINCGATCSASFDNNTAVTLIATPSGNAIFAGWGGDPDCVDGAVTMTASKTCSITFNLSLQKNLSAGGEHGCALLSDARINCWGGNGFGELGNGTTTLSSIPVLVSGIASATAVSAGASHSCALLSDGRINCWGGNFSGQLGNGKFPIPSSIPVLVSGITNATAVSAGQHQNCALLLDGGVSCWGENGFGQIGNGTTTSSSIPVLVSGITSATAVSAGANHSCALLSDGGINCWGSNFFGGLGNGTRTDSSIPVLVSGITNATAVSAGFGHSCALLSDGRINCWGGNFLGQLGNGATTNSLIPVLVSGITSATAISAGSEHSCALLLDGRVSCWGENGFGQLGNGATTNSLTPVLANGITSATAISAGSEHSCALLSDGRINCWGHNAEGQLGNGTTTNSSIPVDVIGIP